MQTTLSISIRLLTICSLFALPAAAIRAKAQDASSAGNLQFNYAFVALTDNGESPKLVAVESNQRLRSGDKLKFYLEALSEAYLYLFHVDPDGVLSQVFPGSQQNAKVPLDRKVSIPSGNKWLELDSRTGMEKFYLIASQNRQERLENLYTQYDLTVEGTESFRRSREEILDEINKIRQNNLSKNAERPVRIGGSFRGPGSNASEPGLDITHLASKVATTGAYSRFFTIDHR